MQLRRPAPSASYPTVVVDREVVVGGAEEEGAVADGAVVDGVVVVAPAPVVDVVVAAVDELGAGVTATW